MLEDVSLLAIDCSLEEVTLGEEVDSPVRSSTPAPPVQSGTFQEISTSRSRVLPELRWMQDLNMTLETPPSPAPALPLLPLQQQVSTLDLAADTVETVEEAVEHLLKLLEAAVPDAAVLNADAQKEPVRAGADLGGLRPPLQPTPAKGQQWPA